MPSLSLRSLKSFGSLALNVLQFVVPIIHTVQSARANDPGPIKQQAVIDELTAVLDGLGKENIFSNSPAKLAATKQLIDDIVKYKNAMAAADAQDATEAADEKIGGTD